MRVHGGNAAASGRVERGRPTIASRHLTAAVTTAGAREIVRSAVGSARPQRSLRVPPAGRGAFAAWSALAVLVLGTVAVVAVAAHARSPLVPASYVAFPGWLAGPLHGLLGGLVLPARVVQDGASAVLGAMTLAYLVLLRTARRLSLRAIAAAVVVLHAVLLLSPPLSLSDLFNYLGYARLGVLHHLNPYTHVIADEHLDPIARLSTWRHWHSPYGPLFTAASYAVGRLPLPVAYWVLKLAAVSASLAFLAVLDRCARGLHRDRRLVLVLVTANPIYLLYAIGGFHNDFFMLALSTGAIALVLARREHAGGASLAAAIGVKFTVVLLLPFLLLGAREREHRRRVLAGLLLGAIPLALLSVALFGLSLPNVLGQSGLITGLSVPNLAGLALGAGGAAAWVTHVADLLVVLVVVLAARHCRDWIAGAGWATLALLASLAWLMPWYVTWVLPLAALSGSLRLRRAALLATVFVVLTFMPVTSYVLHDLHLNPMGGAVGRRAVALQRRDY